MTAMAWVYDDGGRARAGFKGKAGDCVVRSVAIASGLPYAEVYEVLSEGMRQQRAPRGRRYNHSTARRKPDSARNGVSTTRKWFRDYMAALGFTWVPTMRIGSGCKVHLVSGELPMGRLVVAVSKHYTAVIDGVIRDTHNPQREPQNVYSGSPARCADGQLRNPIIHTTGGRCVYGYWIAQT